MRNLKRPIRVGVSGSYGGLNLGDEAILQGIVTQLRASLPVEVIVFSRNAEDTQSKGFVDRAVQIRRLNRNQARDEVEQLDALILGGGGILYDEEALVYLREVSLALDLGIPVMIYGISLGPLQNVETRRIVKELLQRVDVLSVRDRQARRFLEELGIEREIHLTADPALLIEPEETQELLISPENYLTNSNRPLVGFSVREPGPAAPNMDVTHYHQLLAQAADFIVDRLDADVIFIPMERKNQDIQQSHAVVSRMQCAERALVLRQDLTPSQLLSLMGRLDFAIGMRLHFLIFAALQGIPFLALPYASKVTGFLEEFELEVLPMEKVSTGRLIARIDRSWDLRRSIADQIKRTLPDLKDRARHSNELFLEMLREHSQKEKRAAS